MQTRFNRRHFLKVSAATAAVSATAGAVYWSRREAIRVALIGVGNRGCQLGKDLAATCIYPLYAQIVAICDVDRAHAEEARSQCAPHAELYEDYRKVLERDDIQAVVIATPDHWHSAISLAAMQAGKAVYCEKPMTLTIDEGKQLVQVAKQTGCVFQVGTQQRSYWRFQQACELVRNGRLGNLHTVTISLPGNLSGGPFATQPVPPGLNWDLWLGQAPWAEYCMQRCHYHFRGWYEYSGGELTDWGTHHIDIAQLALGMDHSGPLSIDSAAELPRIPGGFNMAREFSVVMEYPQGVRMSIKTTPADHGILFEGDGGRIFVNRQRLSGTPVDDLQKNPLPEDAVRFQTLGNGLDKYPMIHLRNFLQCIKTGETPVSDVVSQHRSASACHLANISIRLGRKLVWDAGREQFVGDAEADGMLTRPQRAPYTIGT